MNKFDLTPEKILDIKKKAEAAEGVAPSPWKSNHTSEEYRMFSEVRDNDDYQVVYDLTREEAEHIAAADPATVLALLQEIERLQQIDYPDPDWK